MSFVSIGGLCSTACVHQVAGAASEMQVRQLHNPFCWWLHITWEISDRDAQAPPPRPWCQGFGVSSRHMHFKKAGSYDSACCRDLHLFGSHCFRVFLRMAATHQHEVCKGAAQTTAWCFWKSEWEILQHVRVERDLRAPWWINPLRIRRLRLCPWSKPWPLWLQCCHFPASPEIWE